MKNNKKAFTLIEIITASVVFSLFLGGCYALYSYSQRSISRANWQNKSTSEEALTKKILSEFTKSSSYPSTVRRNLIKTAENSSLFKANIIANTSTLTSGANEVVFFSFPICKEQTETDPGTIKWVRLRLVGQGNKSFSSLIIDESNESNYSPSAPNYAENLNSNGINQAIFTKKHRVLSDIKEIEFASISENKNSVDITFHLSCPNDEKLTKEITLTLNLNVEIVEK